MKNKKIALVLCLDQNKDNKYEYECLYCIKSWKRNANNLANIDILVYINDNANISSSTIKELLKYKNVFIKKYKYPSYKHNHILLTKLYCWYLFEKFESAYQYGIYTDLDLYLIDAIPENFIFNDKNIFCVYKNIDNFEKLINYRFKNNQQKHIYTFNSEFIINNCKNKIFEKLVKLIDNEQYELFFNTNILYNNDMYYYEEGIYDYAFYTNIINNNNSKIVDLKEISGLTESCFIHKHIKSFTEYINFCKKHNNILNI